MTIHIRQYGPRRHALRLLTKGIIGLLFTALWTACFYGLGEINHLKREIHMHTAPRTPEAVDVAKWAIYLREITPPDETEINQIAYDAAQRGTDVEAFKRWREARNQKEVRHA